MIMKRIKLILTTLLSISILCISACSSVSNSNTTETTLLTENALSTVISVDTEKTEATETTFITEDAETEITTTVSTEESEETTETTIAITTVDESEVTAVTTEMSEKKYIALTFDDGPNTTTTNDVLDVIEKYGIKASFFLIGNNINEESEKVVKRAYDMGCEIGNHSKTHSDMSVMSEEEMLSEVNYVSDYIFKITGEKPKFFRPPYIAVSDKMIETIDMVFIAGFGANDWDDKVTADRRAKMIIRQAKNGGIILLHDAKGNDKTVEALHTIIPELQSQGYEFVTVSELFEVMNVSPEPHDQKIYTYADQQYMYG